MEELEFAVESIQLPELKSNFEAFKNELVLAVSQFKIEVTENNIQEAKKMMASLNKIKANISEKGKETVAIFKKPADTFREQIKELENICDVSRADISLQVYRFEDAMKAECEKLLIKLIADLRGDYKIESRFYSAKYDDCIKLTAITAKGGLTKAIKEGIQARVQKEQFNQQLYHGRYKEVESECMKAGISPFTETSVAHILALDYEDFKARLIANIQAERIRNEDIQKKADEKARREAEAVIRAEEVKRLQDKAKTEKEESDKKLIAETEAKINAEIASGVRTKSGAIKLVHAKPEEVYTAPSNDGRMTRQQPEAFIPVAENKPIAPWVIEDVIEDLKTDLNPIIRPSSLPRIMSCTNSRHAPETKIEEQIDGNIEGVAMHKFVEIWFKTNRDIKEIIGEVEDKYKVDVAWLCWNMVKMLTKFKAHLKDIQSEYQMGVELPFGNLKGTCDLVGSMDESRAVIIDVKAGFRQADYTAQLKGYGLILFKNNPKLEKILIVTAYAQNSKMTNKTYTRGDSEQFENELMEIYQGKKNCYMVGDNCTYCPLRYECTAKQGVLNATISELVENETDLINPELYDRVQLVKKAVRKYDELFKQKVEAEGEVRIGINTFYMDNKVKEVIRFDETTLQFFYEKYGAKISSFLKLSNTDLEEHVKKDVTNGLKQAEWRAFFEDMSKRGYTTQETNRKLSKK